MIDLKRNTNYLIDEDGNLFSKRFNKKLNPKRNHDGYLRIQLWKNNKCTFTSIHRLVAENFIENPLHKPFVNHKDGNKQNNSVNNLEWCTQKENIKHSFENGFSKPFPKNHPFKSKPVIQYDLLFNYINRFPSQMEVERQLKIPHWIIRYYCKTQKRYKDCYFRHDITSNDYR